MGLFQSTPNNEEDDSSSRCRIWTGVHLNEFIYPEFHEACPEILNKQNYGIALSGGGCRALTYSIGTLRGLHMMNLLVNARYVSTNSGSSWLNGPLAYSQTDLSEFLGEYLPPQQCTKKQLRKIDKKSHAFFLCHDTNLHTFLRELRESLLRQDGNDTRGFWSQAIGHIFFRRYNLNYFDYLPAVKGPHEEQILSQTGYSPNKLTPYDPLRYPYPILNGSIIIRGREMSAPLEFTPLYYGIPGTFHYEGNDLEKFPVGGYLIDPYGFTSNPSDEQRQTIKRLLESQSQPLSGEIATTTDIDLNIANDTTLPPSALNSEIRKPERIISVSEQAGISSSAMAQVVAHHVTTEQGKTLHMTVRPLWNPISGEIHDVIMSDGLGGDNTAIHSLLRRKVQKICAMFAINISIMANVDHRNMSQSGFADIAALFGEMTCDSETTIDGVRPSSFNKFRQVFPNEDFNTLLNGLKNNCLKGKPCTYLLHTHALPNPLVGIPGGHPVDLLLILCNAESSQWMSSLPEKTRSIIAKNKCFSNVPPSPQPPFPEEEEEEEEKEKELEEEEKEEEEEAENLGCILDYFDEIFQDIGEDLHEMRALLRQIFKRSDLRDFPYPVTESVDYSPELVNLLTNLMTWEVLESRELFQEFLS